jgi:hypothetical protein
MVISALQIWQRNDKLVIPDFLQLVLILRLQEIPEWLFVRER